MTHTEEDEKYEKKVSQSILASMQKIVTGEAGQTGSWRSVRPIFNADKCIVVKTNKPTCHLCWLYCPENTVSRTIPPKIDYDYCKGCGICAKECPTDAIIMVPEREEE